MRRIRGNQDACSARKTRTTLDLRLHSGHPSLRAADTSVSAHWVHITGWKHSPNTKFGSMHLGCSHTRQRRNPPFRPPFQRQEPFRREQFRAPSNSGPTSNVVVSNDNVVVRRSTFNDQRCAIVTEVGRAAKADGVSLRGKCPAVCTSTKVTPEERFSQCPCPRKPGHEGPYAPAHTGVPSQEIRAKWSRTQGPGAFSKRIDWSEAVRRFGL